MLEEKSETDQFLNSTFGKKGDKSLAIPERAGRKSKIELAGEQVMAHLMKLAETTDLSYNSMAKKINEEYGLEISKENVVHFFRSNATAIIRLADEKRSLSKIRAEIYLEHNSVLVKDIKTLDAQITELVDDSYLEVDRKAKALGDLIDKKGRLLLRQARLSGRLDTGTNIGNVGNMQVNIFKQMDSEQSELIKRLKKADFKEKPKKVIDVTPKNEK